ncbi:lasso peptide biosynthesis PqqD family chaperone [Bacillus sp. EB106-08-02-XG196]|uniref:lasso peptide biosynthesis PqqD family chaperone n=1 Tax=Bacillus sp. EB106-08-02-XG196 TaxID=2737049 RepID=UPI0015C47D24|nr:lasso peptide biosynthesis PqqD family chaperone [Bacillus sp. EB106-08-02-XG196]NWQ39186.1 lasso peptide biosynthesis PqqD family chaperone [Bacillus sp. EB106-08-02-XG196]
MLNTNKLYTETIIVQSPGNIISDMDGETVMMSIDNGKYYNLGVIGGYIWGNIGTPITIKTLVSKLSNEFNVEDSQCKKDVIHFLEQLLNEKIIMIEKGLKDS